VNIRSADERAMFSASSSRAQLARGEPLEPLIARAASAALRAAGIRAIDVDRLYGAAVLGAHVEPSPLYAVHRALGLRRDAAVVPQGTNFSGFITGVGLAAEAVRSGVARHVLVVAGAAMSEHVPRDSGYAVSIADGAGAVVVGPGSRDVVLDFATDTDGSLYDATTMDAKDGRVAFSIAETSLRGVHDYGVERPPALVADLLRRHGVAPSDVTLVAHQASRVLIEHWRSAIAPGEYVETFDEHGNATVASVPISLATRIAAISKPYLLLMSPGMGMHAAAVLVRR